jgi:hypothetical protein
VPAAKTAGIRESGLGERGFDVARGSHRNPRPTISAQGFVRSLKEATVHRTQFAFGLAIAGLVAILVPSNLQAQTSFDRAYGGANHDEGGSVQQTTDGGYVVAGYTGSFGAGDADVYLLKTDAAGDTLWTRTFGGIAWDQGNSVQQTTDGGYIVAGYTGSFGAGNYDVYLIKTDATGETLWTRTYGDSSDDAGFSVQQTADGGFVVTGLTGFVMLHQTDVRLIKTDATGDTVWTRTLGGSNADRGNSVQQTTDGGYVICGYTSPSAADTVDVYLIKTDASGDTLWTKTFGGPGFEHGNSVQQTTDSGYIIAGYATSFGAGGYDVYLIKTDASGDTLWTRTFGDTDWDQGSSVQQTTDGGYIVAGYITPPESGDRDVYLIKTDADGRVAVEEPKPTPPCASVLSVTCEPNPFCTNTRISLTSQAASPKPLTLRVYDAQGRIVRTLTIRREPFSAWDGKDDCGHLLPSGAYFVRCDVAGARATTRLVLQH